MSSTGSAGSSPAPLLRPQRSSRSVSPRRQTNANRQSEITPDVSHAGNIPLANSSNFEHAQPNATGGVSSGDHGGLGMPSREASPAHESSDLPRVDSPPPEVSTIDGESDRSSSASVEIPDAPVKKKKFMLFANLNNLFRTKKNPKATSGESASADAAAADGGRPAQRKLSIFPTTWGGNSLRTNAQRQQSVQDVSAGAPPSESQAGSSRSEPAAQPAAAPAQAPAGASAQAPVGAPAQAPVGASAQASVGAPAQAPVGAPAQAPVGAPAQAPVGAPAQAPVGASAQAPVGAPAQAPVGASAQAPVGAPAQAPVGASAQAPAGAPNQAPVGAPRVAAEDVFEDAVAELPRPNDLSTQWFDDRRPNEGTIDAQLHAIINMKSRIMAGTAENSEQNHQYYNNGIASILNKIFPEGPAEAREMLTKKIRDMSDNIAATLKGVINIRQLKQFYDLDQDTITGANTANAVAQTQYESLLYDLNSKKASRAVPPEIEANLRASLNDIRKRQTEMDAILQGQMGGLLAPTNAGQFTQQIANVFAASSDLFKERAGGQALVVDGRLNANHPGIALIEERDRNTINGDPNMLNAIQAAHARLNPPAPRQP